jgi:hypothetical protein
MRYARSHDLCGERKLKQYSQYYWEIYWKKQYAVRWKLMLGKPNKSII